MGGMAGRFYFGGARIWIVQIICGRIIFDPHCADASRIVRLCGYVREVEV